MSTCATAVLSLCLASCATSKPFTSKDVPTVPQPKLGTPAPPEKGCAEVHNNPKHRPLPIQSGPLRGRYAVTLTDLRCSLRTSKALQKCKAKLIGCRAKCYQWVEKVRIGCGWQMDAMVKEHKAIVKRHKARMWRRLLVCGAAGLVGGAAGAAGGASLDPPPAWAPAGGLLGSLILGGTCLLLW